MRERGRRKGRSEEVRRKKRGEKRKRKRKRKKKRKEKKEVKKLFNPYFYFDVFESSVKNRPAIINVSVGGFDFNLVARFCFSLDFLCVLKREHSKQSDQDENLVHGR